MASPSASQGNWGLAGRCWLAAVASCGLLGLGIARLTLGLNGQLNDSPFDVLLLTLYGLGLYGLAGVVVGGVAAAGVGVLDRLFAPARWLQWLPAFIGAAPLVFFFMLPEVGLSGQLLSDLLWSAKWSSRVLPLATLVGGAVALAGLVQLLPTRWRTLRNWAFAWQIVAVFLVVTAGEPVSEIQALEARYLKASAAADEPSTEVPTAEEWIADIERKRAQGLPAAPSPDPVLLLCIDGVDLRVVEELVSQGELPTFASLMAEGTWGRLTTLEPTLSPIIWTTLITGQTPRRHGIHHFLHFKIPGLEAPIYQFPLHTGLNFRFFPLLRKIPGMPKFQSAVTSGMRRALALWHMVERLHTVGAYRWLMTWPAEPVRGFFVSGGIGWVQPGARPDSEISQPATVYPEKLFAEMPSSEATQPSAPELAAFVGEGFELDSTDPRLRPIYGQYRDPTVHQLPWLLERFQPKFTAAAFYPVDAAHHLFTEYRGRGGVFSGAVEQAYRFTDQRLGELLEQIESSTQLLVVSDHGYDFVGNHHTHAPPGIFMARGPAFEAGRRLDDLSVYDVAPLVLRLLDMPLPMDLPGSQSRAYEAALSQTFARQHPATEIQSYEGWVRQPPPVSGEAFPDETELRELLEALGYVEGSEPTQ